MFEDACLKSTWTKPSSQSVDEMFNWSVSIYFNKLNKDVKMTKLVQTRLSECLNKERDKT